MKKNLLQSIDFLFFGANFIFFTLEAEIKTSRFNMKKHT